MNKKALITICIMVLIFSEVLVIAEFSDLTNEQKQFYWGCLSDDGCLSLLKEKEYANYRTCALSCTDKASQQTPEGNWCKDTDNGIDYFTSGTITTNIYLIGKQDYCYTFPNGKEYLFEGVCKNNKYVSYQKRCKELGKDLFCSAGACVENQIPTISFVTPTPKDGAIVQGIQTIKAVANDLDGKIEMIKIYFSEDGINYIYLQFCIDSNECGLEWDTTKYPNGQYWFKAEAEDNKGASNIVKSTFFTDNGIYYCDSNYFDSAIVKLNKGEKLSFVKPVLTDEDLPLLLKDGTFTNKKGNFLYTQRLFFENQKSGEAGYYFYIEKSDPIARYRLTFNTPVESSIYDSMGLINSSGTVLKDFEYQKINIFGKEYTLVLAQRYAPYQNPILQNTIKLTLMGGAVIDTLSKDESGNYEAESEDGFIKKYKVTATYIDNDEAKFKVNGEATNKLKVGEAYVLSDKSEIGVSKIILSEEGKYTIEFFLGAEKIILKDDDITDDTSSHEFDFGSEQIDGGWVTVKGTDDNNIFTISSIEVNMIAEKSYYTAVGESLSDTIVAKGKEKEVLFTNNWDIRFNGYDETSDKAILEIGKLCPIEK